MIEYISNPFIMICYLSNKKYMSKKKILAIVVPIIIIVSAATAAMAALNDGQKSLQTSTETEKPVIEYEEEITEEEQTKWQDDWVKFDGEIYSYKKDIMTFLIMGTDQKSGSSAQSGSLDGGQADFLILLVLDPTKKKIEFIPINRNTMAEVDVYDANGNVTGTAVAQIAVQHGVGNGLQESCEYEVKAVSRLFYQLPIHGYASMTMKGIIPLTDTVSGVDVTVPADAKTPSFTYQKGENVHLEGMTAYNFVHDRDQEVGGADRRLERQKVFMKALITKLLKTVKSNPTSVLNIYNAVADYTTTDITTNELVYIASKAAGYGYDGGSFYSIKGETKVGEVSDEFHIDEDEFKKLIIEVFYEKVED